MKKIIFSEDTADLIFRILFSSIFLGLGAEHIFSDDLIQNLMPHWIPFARVVSIGCGIILIAGGLSIFLGYRIKAGAVILGLFLISVTTLIHLVGAFKMPADLPEQWRWLWNVFHRSNLVKNLCLLGVCIKLYYLEPKRFTLEWLLHRRASNKAD